MKLAFTIEQGSVRIFRETPGDIPGGIFLVIPIQHAMDIIQVLNANLLEMRKAALEEAEAQIKYAVDCAKNVLQTVELRKAEKRRLEALE